MHGEHTRVVGISLILFISPYQFRLELLAWRNFIDSIPTAFGIDQLTCSHLMHELFHENILTLLGVTFLAWILLRL